MRRNKQLTRCNPRLVFSVDALYLVGMNSKFTKADAAIRKMKVEEIDANLADLVQSYSYWLGIRAIKAKQEGIKTPPPLLPNNPDTPAPPAIDMIQRVDARLDARRAVSSPPGALKILDGSGPDVALKIIARHPTGITAQDFREAYERAHEADPKLDRLHFNSLRRLKEPRHVILYKKRLFTHGNLAAFFRNLDAGLVADITDVPKSLTGKWGVAIMDYLNRFPNEWTEYKFILEHMSTLPEFANNTNIGTQVAVALSALRKKHHLIEKKKNRGTGFYRVISPTTASNKEGDMFKTAEAEASAVH